MLVTVNSKWCTLQVPAEEEQEGGETEDKEATPVRVFPPQTKLDVQAPRTPSKRSKHPTKPSTEPATKRARCTVHVLQQNQSPCLLSCLLSTPLLCYTTIAAVARSSRG